MTIGHIQADDGNCKISSENVFPPKKKEKQQKVCLFCHEFSINYIECAVFN